MKKNRCIELDFYKAILCVLVVFGHSLTQSVRTEKILDNIFYILYTFHMPVFFIISGIVYYNFEKKYKLKDYFKNKVFRLIIPYISTTLFVYIVFDSISIILNNLLGLRLEFYNLRKIIEGIILSYSNIAKHLWFIYVLFIICIISKTLETYMKKNRLICIIVSVILSIYAYRYTESVYSLIARVLYYNFYFQLGNIILKSIFTNKKIIINKMKFITVCISIFVANNLLLFSLRANNNLNQTIKWFFLLVSSISSFFIILILIKNWKNNKYFKKIFIIISKYNFEIYLLHNPFITLGSVTLFTKILNITPIIAILIGIVLGISIPIFISKYFIRKNKVLKLIILGEK